MRVAVVTKSYLDAAQTVDDILGVRGGVRGGQRVTVVTAGVAGGQVGADKVGANSGGEIEDQSGDQLPGLAGTLAALLGS